MTSMFSLGSIFCSAGASTNDDALQLTKNAVYDDNSVDCTVSSDFSDAQLEECATKIQALVRGMLVRDFIRDAIRNHMLVRIQSASRGMIAREGARKLKRQNSMKMVSPDIQSQKSAVTQELTTKLKSKDIKRRKSAILIQAMIRGVLDRNEIRNEIREISCILIQCHTRGMILRNQLRNEIKDHSCILLQSVVRVMLAKNRARELMKEKQKRDEEEAARGPVVQQQKKKKNIFKRAWRKISKRFQRKKHYNTLPTVE